MQVFPINWLVIVVSVVYVSLANVAIVMLEKQKFNLGKDISPIVRERILFYQLSKKMGLVWGLMAIIGGIALISVFAPNAFWIPLIGGMILFGGIVLPMFAIITLIAVVYEERLPRSR